MDKRRSKKENNGPMTGDRHIQQGSRTRPHTQLLVETSSTSSRPFVVRHEHHFNTLVNPNQTIVFLMKVSLTWSAKMTTQRPKNVQTTLQIITSIIANKINIYQVRNSILTEEKIYMPTENTSLREQLLVDGIM